MKKFVHLHTHTGFSILDGMTKIPDLVTKVSEDGAPAVAITDHGTMGGTVQLVSECNKAGIKAIPGIEFYHAMDRFNLNKKKGDKANNHLTALSYTHQGYQNLMEMSSRAQLESKHGKWGFMDDELLADNSEGIIITSSCLSSLISQHLLKGDYDAALAQAAQHRDIVGKENYFIEIQRHGIEDQEKILGDQLRLAKDLGVGLVATNDSHYTSSQDAQGHETLLCVQTGKTLKDPDHFKFDGDGSHYVKSADEMYDLFPHRDFPDACNNTLEIAERCEHNISVGTTDYLLPKFDLSQDEELESITISAQKNGTVPATEKLRSIVLEQAHKTYDTPSGELPQAVADRIDHELKIIDDMGFPDYFLILSDCVNWAKEQGIAVGPARGCLTGNTEVICDNGYHLIDEVQIGQKVFTHENRWRTVENIFEYPLEEGEKIYRIKAMHSKEGVGMTGDHKVLIADGQGNRKWVEAQNITLNDYVCIPKTLEGLVHFSNQEIEQKIESHDFSDYADWDRSTREKIVDKVGLNEDYEYALCLKGQAMNFNMLKASCGIPDTFAYQKSLGTSMLGVFEDNRFVYSPVVDISTSTKYDVVYDIQVEEDHSFLTDEFVVHNSAAGSLVAYLAGITGVDPLQFQLLFERFLNPHRSGMPDIDVDFDPTRQPEVVNYLIEKYGADRVSLIATYGYLKIKSSIKDSARAMGYPPAVGNKLSSLIPAQDMIAWSGTLADYASEKCPEHIASNDKLKSIWSDGAEFRRVIKTDQASADVIDMAVKIEGSTRSTGEHPAGVLLTPDVLWRHTPVRSRTKKKGDHNVSMAVSEYDKNDVESIGGLKFDFLMIVNLPIMKRTLELIKKTTGKDIDLNNLPQDDAQVYSMLSKGISSGVFQFDKDGAIRMLQEIHPDGFHDLYNISAINRPGPLASSMDQSYAKRKAGREKKTLIDPELDKLMPAEVKKELKPYLEDTYGLCVPEGTLIYDATTGQHVPIEEFTVGHKTPSRNMTTGNVENKPVNKVWKTGIKDIVSITLYDGKEIKLSATHPVLTDKGWVNAGDLKIKDWVVMGNSKSVPDSTISNAKFSLINQVVSVKSDGTDVCYDMEVADNHTFLVNDVVVHNCVYQEQIMFVAQIIAGYTTAEADNFRRVISKKKLKEMEAMQEDFFAKGKAKGYDVKFMQKLWDILLPFSDYCFNKSHAVGYAVISYQTAWLKCHYPEQFTAACVDFFDSKKVPAQIASARELGVSVQAPDINRSTQWSTTTPGNIWIGFGLVDGIGDAAIEKLVHARETGGLFKSLDDVAQRSHLSQSQLEALIKLGALRNINENRRGMLSVLPDVIEHRDKEKSRSAKTFSSDLTSLFGGGQEDESQDHVTSIPDIEDFSDKDLDGFARQHLGFILGDHPCEGMRKTGLPAGFKFADEVSFDDVDSIVDVVGVAENISYNKSSNGKDYVTFELNSGLGVSKVLFFGEEDIVEGEVMVLNAKAVEDTFRDSEEVKLMGNHVSYDLDLSSARGKKSTKKTARKPAKRKKVVVKNGGEASSTDAPRRKIRRKKTSDSVKESNENFEEKKNKSTVNQWIMIPKDQFALVQAVELLQPFFTVKGTPVFVSVDDEKIRAPFSVSDSVEWDEIEQCGVKIVGES